MSLIKPDSPDPRTADIDPARIAAAAAQVLTSRLREAEGRIPGRWSEAAAFPGCVDSNELFSLVFAWRHRDPAVARDLVCAVLAGEQDNGDLPRAICPNGQVAQAEPAWPFVVQAARLAYLADKRGDPEFLPRILPALFRIVGNQLDLLDSGDQGQPRWPSEASAYLSDIWDPGLRMVDLSAFLLAEIEALLELELEVNAFDVDEPGARMEVARRRLAESLERDLWCEAESVFRDRLAGGEFIARATVSGYAPLLWRGLPTRMRQAVLHRLASHGELMTDSGIAAWEMWPEDPERPPVRAIDQILVLSALETAGDVAVLSKLRPVLVHRICAESHPEDVFLAASFLAKGPDTSQAVFKERRLRWIAALGAALLLIVLLVVIALGNSRKSMTSSMTEALTGLARNHYMNRNYEEAARIYDRVVGDSRSSVPALHYLYANTLFHLGEFARAEDQYRLALREEMLSNPRVHFNLAQVLLRQAKYEEARRIFMDIMDEYDDYPDVIQRCQLVLVYMDRFGGKSVESGFAPVKGE